MSQLLKLRAKDAEDLQVISAVLQDSIVPVCDMVWQPENKNFILVAQRLCREGKRDAGLERICCAIHLSGIEAAQTHGIDLADAGRMLDLLAVMPEGKNLQLIFAGGARIRLELSEWSMIIEDFGEPWPAQCEPCHEDEERDKRQKAGE